MAAAIRAEAASLSGRWDEAAAAYPKAIALLQAMDYHLDAAILGLEFGAFLGARDERARAAGEEAEAWFSQRGASGVVDRYRAAFKAEPAPPAGLPEGARSQAAEVEVR